MNAIQLEKKNGPKRIEAEQKPTIEEKEEQPTNNQEPQSTEPQEERKSFLEKWSEKLKDFLDNAE
eukprot:GDKH01014720.1.p1 GENE.GDKH01014720.1~~GDKH01014720.1.p1  ORF type:complete len:76 (-),score=5.85 GDKH01014720.1:68-262(-)